MDSESEDIIINQCPECAQDLDVTDFPPFSKIVCPSCEATVRVRNRLGQYEIKYLLGEGGMSQVFAAEDTTLGRTVALKILHQSLSQDDKLTEMFEREAKLTASINHPNVVKVYTVGREKGYFYIAMELVNATSVEQMIAEQGALPELQVLQIAHDVVSGLDAAYRTNLIHRDIKPGNMLVTPEGTTKLVDFGLAIAQGGADENEDLWATPFYVPPEKLVREPDTHLGDIYALGATCYHALAGKPPFEANTGSLEELIEIKKEPVNLREAAPGASKVTVKLIEQMMAHSAAVRPSSYDKLLVRIEACKEEKGGLPASNVHTVQTSGAQKLVRLAFVVVPLIVLLIAVLALQDNGDDPGVDLEPAQDRVISEEEREAVSKMLAGRQAMIDGQFPRAKRTFEELILDDRFDQPIRSWNTFNRGLVELLWGDEKGSREIFAGLATEEGFGSEELEAYARFFGKMSRLLTDPLPIRIEEIAAESDSFETIGWFAAGLKNWELGQFESADRLFTTFEKTDSPSSERWIADLKKVARRYRTDYQLLQGLPNPSRKMNLRELEDTITALVASRDSLKTRGALPGLVERRLERGNEFLALEKKAQAERARARSQEWSSAELGELGRLQAKIDSLNGVKTSYLFSDAVNELEALSTDTTKGEALRQDLIEGFRAASRFVESLAIRLNEDGYEGVVRRRSGRALDAAITAATPDSFTVDLGFGPNEVEVVAFEPSWLVEAAEATLEEPSEENISSWLEVFWFSRILGLEDESRRIATLLVALDEDFRKAGQRFAKVSFGD